MLIIIIVIVIIVDPKLIFCNNLYIYTYYFLNFIIIKIQCKKIKTADSILLQNCVIFNINFYLIFIISE